MSKKPSKSELHEQVQQARNAAPPGPAGRMATQGMPVERSENFKASTRRLLALLRPDRFGVLFVIALSFVGTAMSVYGPKVLGRATNLVFEGLRRARGGGSGIEFDRLHRILFFAVGLYVVSAMLQWLQSVLLAGIVQRTMAKLRTAVEEKLNRLPLPYIDSQPRGDLLSRVTNDIDNVSQSLQQTLSQLLSSVLTLIGVLIMMLTISWILALVSIIAIPLSLYGVKLISKQSRKRFIAQWKHTGTLNAHVEEVFTGHALVKAFGRQADVEKKFDTENEKLYEAAFGAQSISWRDPTGHGIRGQPQLCGHRSHWRSSGCIRSNDPR